MKRNNNNFKIDQFNTMFNFVIGPSASAGIISGSPNTDFAECYHGIFLLISIWEIAKLKILPHISKLMIIRQLISLC